MLVAKSKTEDNITSSFISRLFTMYIPVYPFTGYVHNNNKYNSIMYIIV